jgi:uncharacterized repeat protein (TIGR03803 family)
MPVAVASVLTVMPTATQTFKTVHSFDDTDGYEPITGLVQATDRNLYGTTLGGGTDGGYGTVFKITPAGSLTSLDSFDTSNGSFPSAGLVQGTDEKFYVTTSRGGPTVACPRARPAAQFSKSAQAAR